MMNTIVVFSILVLILSSSAFAVGYMQGDKAVRVDVFKNCLAARIHPTVCINYMKIIKNREYKFIAPAKKAGN